MEEKVAKERGKEIVKKQVKKQGRERESVKKKWEKQRGEINSFVVYILNSIDTKSQIKQYIYTNRLASADITIISNTNYTIYY